MPFTLLAHQAFVAPLKRYRPRLFSGTALALGSMAPDLQYFLFQTLEPMPGHSLGGQFFLCLPLTLFLVWLTRRFVARPLAAHLPQGGAFHFEDYRALAAPPRRGDLARVVTSALAGSFSHVLIDSATHRRGFITAWLPMLSAPVAIPGFKPFPMYRLTQNGLSIIGVFLAIAFLYSIGKKRLLLAWAERVPPPLRATRASRRILWISTALCTAVGFVVRCLLGRGHFYPGEIWFWGHEVLQLTCFAGLGVVIGCVLCARKMEDPDTARA